MKKTFGIFILGMFIISMMAGVSADGIVDDIKAVGSGIFLVFEPILKVVIGEKDSVVKNGDKVMGLRDIFLAKILFLIIILAIVWKSLEKISFFSDNEWVLWVVSIAVSILSVRLIGDTEIIHTILLPYSALGIAITAGIPFIIYFFVVNSFHKTMRKVAWIFFIVIFIGLFFARRADTIGGPIGDFAYIYLVTAGLAFLVLFADKTIQRTIKKSAVEANKEIAIAKRRTQLIGERHELEGKKMNNTVTDRDYRIQDEHLKKSEKKYDII